MTIANNLTVANGPDTQGQITINRGTLTTNRSLSAANGNNANVLITVTGGTLDVNDTFTLGRADQQSTVSLRQTGGILSVDTLVQHPGTNYQLTGGELQIQKRQDLLGNLNFTANSSAKVTVADNAVLDWSRGGLIGDPSQMTFSAGANSESYFPAGFDPRTKFASFSSQGLVHTVGTTLVVPFGFTMNVRGDRPDRMRVEGLLRPEGSPSNPLSLTLDEGGVEVAPGGVFNLHGASLTAQTSLAVLGGDLRSVSQLTIGNVTGKQASFSQTSGLTQVTNALNVGVAEVANADPRGRVEISGGTLSVAGSVQMGLNTICCDQAAFADGTWLQSNGQVTIGNSFTMASHRSAKSTLTLDGGSLTIANNLTVANGPDTQGQITINRGTLTTNRSLSAANGNNANVLITVTGGTLDVNDTFTLGRADQQSTVSLRQTGGILSVDTLVQHPGTNYQLTGGELQIQKRQDLLGNLNFTASSSAKVTVADNAVLDWSRGSLIGDPSQMTFLAALTQRATSPLASIHAPSSPASAAKDWFIPSVRR